MGARKRCVGLTVLLRREFGAIIHARSLFVISRQHLPSAQVCIFGQTFLRQVAALNIQDVPTTPRSPWQNAYTERVYRKGDRFHPDIGETITKNGFEVDWRELHDSILMLQTNPAPRFVGNFLPTTSR